MTLTLELPQDLECKLLADAQRSGVSLERYALRLLSGHGPSAERASTTGAAVVAYWRREGIIGSRSDIQDAPEHARKLRRNAERRGRLAS